MALSQKGRRCRLPERRFEFKSLVLWRSRRCGCISCARVLFLLAASLATASLATASFAAASFAAASFAASYFAESDFRDLELLQ
jgi:hypothetical protein